MAIITVVCDNRRKGINHPINTDINNIDKSNAISLIGNSSDEKAKCTFSSKMISSNDSKTIYDKRSADYR